MQTMFLKYHDKKFKDGAPKVLFSRGLQVDSNKTEQHIINKANNSWKNIKQLGSPLGTMEDIKRRKILALAAEYNIEHILKNKRINTNIQNTSI